MWLTAHAKPHTGGLEEQAVRRSAGAVSRLAGGAKQKLGRVKG
jgi:hypothetical protein